MVNFKYFKFGKRHPRLVWIGFAPHQQQRCGQCLVPRLVTFPHVRTITSWPTANTAWDCSLWIPLRDAVTRLSWSLKCVVSSAKDQNFGRTVAHIGLSSPEALWNAAVDCLAAHESTSSTFTAVQGQVPPLLNRAPCPVPSWSMPRHDPYRWLLNIW